MRKQLTLLLPLLATCIISLSHAADDIHYQDIKSISSIVPQQGAGYSIASNVKIDGEYYTFTITPVDSAQIEVTGIPGLLKTLYELSVIEWYKSTPQGNQVWKGAKDSVSSIGKGAKSIVLHPGDSAAAMGRSVAKTGRAIGSFFKGLIKKEPKSSTGEDLNKGAGNFMTEDVARKAAYDLHLDVYSANPLVIALLNEISKKQWAGSIGVSAASYIATPGLSSLGTVTSGALTPGQAKDVTEKLIRDNSPLELNRQLLEIFTSKLGYTKDSPPYTAYVKFLNNPNYNPHQKAYITLYCMHLKNLQNMPQVLDVLANCKKVDTAEILFTQLQLMAALEQNATNITFLSFATASDRIYGITKAGDLIAILPFDYATNNKFMQNELAKLPKVKGSRSIWLIGDATPSFIKLAKSNGIDAVYTGILKFGAFRVGINKNTAQQQ